MEKGEKLFPQLFLLGIKTVSLCLYHYCPPVVYVFSFVPQVKGAGRHLFQGPLWPRVSALPVTSNAALLRPLNVPIPRVPRSEMGWDCTRSTRSRERMRKACEPLPEKLWRQQTPAGLSMLELEARRPPAFPKLQMAACHLRAPSLLQQKLC